MTRRWTMSLWAILGILAYVALVARLFTIQVLDGDEYLQQSERQAFGSVSLLPKRGVIYDRNMRQLAANVMQYSLGVNPTNLEDPQGVARTFSRVTGRSAAHFRKLLKGRRFVWLLRGIDRQTYEKFDFTKLDGLVEERGFGRYYPFRRTAAHILGFTSIDRKGLTGLEKRYEGTLEGTPGRMLVNLDATGNKIPILDRPVIEPVDGNNIVLNLDINFQLIAEEELERGVRQYAARAGMAVIMDPNTGDILSLASYPDFDPNAILATKPDERRNRALVDPFEPGSTFKLVTTAAALERGVFNATDMIFCENGQALFPGGYIRDHKPFGRLSFKEVFSKSSNIGMARIGERVGKQWIYEYARAFGFGSATGIDLLGEERGKLSNHVAWSASDAARTAFGYGLLATAVQITNAYAAVANGGYLMKPRLLRAVYDQEGGPMQRKTKPETIRRVIRPETVAVLKSFMRQVVLNGTGRDAAVKGLDVAGKTGTTKKYDAELGKYSDEKYIASFVGFAPVEQSRLVCLVVLDEPELPYNYGGSSAAPIFSKILKRISPLLSQDPGDRIPRRTPDLAIPNVTRHPVSAAVAILSDYGFAARVEGRGDIVAAQLPLPDTREAPGMQVTLRAKSDNNRRPKSRIIPDVRGKPVREAISIMTEMGFRPTLEGSGVVVRQIPKAKSVTTDFNCKLISKPNPG